MDSFSSLPGTLLVLSLITLPVLAVSLSSPPTSSNDPFRAVVVVYRTQQPEPPLCCLKPLPTIDSPDGPEDVLLSFEEWKLKQPYASPNVLAKLKTVTARGDAPSKANVQHVESLSVDTQLPPELLYLTSDDALPPHFRVPIVDRFNYANMDCSARVHTTHKSAKSASSILSDKRDKYMLSPCSADSQFVVVELCEDIRIDTVQLANFEFFSGVFKDFSVSVAKTYTSTDEGWTPAGAYRAKSVRGVQSFHPPTSLRDFYRFIRIDFQSHYGHEYYCPVSLLRVYGLTHLEEWKWDMWQAESHARLQDSASQSNATHSNATSNRNTNVSVARDSAAEIRTNANSSPLGSWLASVPIREPLSSSGSSSAHTQPRRSDPVLDKREAISVHKDGGQQALATQSTGIHSVTEAISSLSSVSSLVSIVSPSPPAAEHPHLHVHDSETQGLPTLSPQPSNAPTSPLVQQILPVHPAPPQGSGESIYRTIMNRLTTLETNHSLYARYVEEQTAGVREVLRKLNEEVGRLESVSRMQAQMYQRTVHEWERQRLRLEFEHGELLSRVNFLSDEVVLEKRLGIAQLCLLLAVLVFIGLTRGAPAQHPPTMHQSMREWGVRNLSFGSSTEGWNPLQRRSRSPTEDIGSRKAEEATATDSRLLFPISTDSPDPRSEPHAHDYQPAPRPLKFPVASTASLHKSAHASTIYRTPTKPRPLLMVEPHTLPRAEPLSRFHSSSTSSHPQGRSAKRWARSAHLHEVKVLRERRGGGGAKRTWVYKDREHEQENAALEDVFSVSASSSSGFSPAHAKTRGRPPDELRPPLTPMGVVRSQTEEGADADVWIDTDGDEDDVLVVSERAVVLQSPERDSNVFT